MMKKMMTAVAVLTMMALLSACGTEETKKTEINQTEENGFIMDGYASEEGVGLGEVSKNLNPEEVYQKLTYTPEMFYGDYKLFGGEEAELEYAAEMDYFTYNDGKKEMELAKIPYAIKAGPNTWSHYVHKVEEYDWMEVYFYHKTSDGAVYLTFMNCAYSIDDNKLVLKPLKEFSVDEENNRISYEFTDIVMEYEFAFSGRHLTLSADGKSVTMTTGLDAYGMEDYLYIEGYLSPEAVAADTIDFIEFWYESPSDNRIHFENMSDEGVNNATGKIEENGLFTFTIPWEAGTKTYQYVYFLCGDDGIILTDGENTHYYNDSYSDRNRHDVNTFLTEDQTGKLDELSEAELEAIVEKKENLMDDLAEAFNEAGIKVTVNDQTGELAMDASVLFGGDSAVLTDEGKAFLNKFVEVYTTIVFSEKYEGFVSKTMVEGHTAPVSGSTYESGLPLSVERANNVKNYCVSAETGVDTSKLSQALEAVGYSNSKPIKDANGNVDMAACRRVSFKFIINLDK